jgi:hypothetical protein
MLSNKERKVDEAIVFADKKRDTMSKCSGHNTPLVFSFSLAVIQK